MFNPSSMLQNAPADPRFQQPAPVFCSLSQSRRMPGPVFLQCVLGSCAAGRSDPPIKTASRERLMRDMPVARARAMAFAPVFALTSALLFAPGAATAQAEAPFSFAATPGKLPKDVVPLQYTAHIVPDVAANTFRGTQTVEIDVLRPTSTIMLNADNLQIESAALSGGGLGKLKLEPILDKQEQTLRFELARPLAPGKYALALAFRGQINREGRGLFYVNYKAGSSQVGSMRRASVGAMVVAISFL
ncbi:MAG: hypothetical protein EOO80_21815, partial [Oxalobacteraceae bacterium]